MTGFNRALDAFPRRPLELVRHRRTLGNLFWTVAGFLLFAGALAYNFYYMAPSVVDDLWLRGIDRLAAPSELVEGKCRSRVVIATCDLTVSYDVGSGAAPRQADFHYLTLFQSIDDDTSLRIYYDPTHPDRASTSWGRDLAVNRGIAQIILVLVLVALAGGVPLGMMQRQRVRRSLAAAAAAPRPVAAEFLGVSTTRYSSTVRFAWTDPANGVRKKGATRLAGTRQPFWLDKERKTLLALAGPDGKAHLLDQSLGPVVLTEKERQAVMAAVG